MFVFYLLPPSFFGSRPHTGEHLGKWEELTSDQVILGWVRGVSFDLIAPLPQPPVEVKYNLKPPEQQILNRLLLDLKSTGIIVPCANPQFLAGLFLREKSGGGHRLIVDLSPLNTRIQYVHFQMEGLDQALDLLQEGDFMSKTDLSQAYYSLPMDPAMQPLLAFQWGTEYYMFTRMCFGLCLAPRVFTKVLKPVVKWIRRQGARLIAYLDDLWLTHHSQQTCNHLTQLLRVKLHELGFIVNRDKSTTQAVQSLEFLGMTLCSKSMTVAIPQTKRDKIGKLIREIRRRGLASTRAMASLIGKLEALRPAFQMAPLYLRELQRWQIINHENNVLAPLSNHKRQLPLSVLEALRFWEKLLPHIHPREIIVYRGQILRVTSDASLSGWGAVVDNLAIHGSWSPQEKRRSINELELLAIERALTSFPQRLQSRNVLLLGDNTTSLSYIYKMGGTKSATMTNIAIRIWEFVLNQNINLEVEHIRGICNTQADLLSRLGDRSETTEWRLNTRVFQYLNHMWGPLLRDLFASPTNTQLPNFISWKENHTQMNAFHYQWKSGDYAFPPFSLVGKVLNKVRADQCQILLIAPRWEAQSWYPLLQSMLYGHPIPLHFTRHLLQDARGNSHPLGKTLNLTAWPITGIVYNSKVFLKM